MNLRLVNIYFYHNFCREITGLFQLMVLIFNQSVFY